jgi:hypothetical protein
MQARTTQGIVYANNVGVVAAGRVTALEADVSVPSGGATRTGGAVVAGGIRLNYQPAANRSLSFPGANMNYLSVRLELFDSGSGLGIRRFVSHCDDPACSTFTASGVATADPAGFTTTATSASRAAAYDTTYRLKLSLNEGTGVFTWTIANASDGSPDASGTIDASSWVAGAGVGMVLNSPTNGFLSAQLVARASDEGGGGDGAFTTEFGNASVGTNGAAAALFDDFVSMGSSVTVGFSPDRWSPTNGDVFLSGGSLHLTTSVTSSGTGITAGTPLNVMYPASFFAWRADLAVVSDTRAGVGLNSIGMGGAFLNDGSAGGTYDATGDVRATVSLRTDGALYWVVRCSNPACSATTGVVPFTALAASLAHPLGLGTVHTVLQQWDAAAKTFTFRLDDAAPATEVLAVSAPRAPFVPMKWIQTAVNVPAGLPGAQASVEGTVNQVYVNR